MAGSPSAGTCSSCRLTALGAVALSAELTYERQGSGTLFQAMETHAHASQVTVGGRAEASVGRRYLVASAQAAIGAARLGASITPMSSPMIEDVGDALVASLGAGLALRGKVGAAGRRRAWVCLGIDVGYVAQTAVELAARPVGTATLATQATPLGSLDLGGWRSFRSSFVVEVLTAAARRVRCPSVGTLPTSSVTARRPAPPTTTSSPASSETQAHALGVHAALGLAELDALYTGTLRRQQETARIMTTAMAAPAARPLPDLCEYPAFELLRAGLPVLVAEDPSLAPLTAAGADPALLDRAFATILGRWCDGALPPSGLETFGAFAARVQRGLAGVRGPRRRRRIGVVTSGGPIALALARAVGAPPAGCARRGAPAAERVAVGVRLPRARPRGPLAVARRLQPGRAPAPRPPHPALGPPHGLRHPRGAAADPRRRRLRRRARPPAEAEVLAQGFVAADPRLRALRAEVHAAGLWAPHLPREARRPRPRPRRPGAGVERLGRSPLGHYPVFGARRPTPATPDPAPPRHRRAASAVAGTAGARRAALVLRRDRARARRLQPDGAVDPRRARRRRL
ncbi:MAG: hypothetical protein R2939_20715 [Kofleriaceae bacterium]